MLWTFCREGYYRHYEIRLPLDGTGYEMVVRNQDGSARVEKFDNSESLNRRALEVQRQLVSDGWWVAGGGRREKLSET